MVADHRMQVVLSPGSRGAGVLSVDAGDGNQKMHPGLTWCRKKFVQLGDKEERQQPAPELLQLQHPLQASGHAPGPTPGRGGAHPLYHLLGRTLYLHWVGPVSTRKVGRLSRWLEGRRTR